MSEHRGLCQKKQFKTEHSSKPQLPQTASMPEVNAPLPSGHGHDFRKIAIFPKLEVNAPGDRYEREADQTASQVVARLALANQSAVQREDEEENLQRKALDVSTLSATQSLSEEKVQTKPETSLLKIVQRIHAPTEDEELQRKPSIQRAPADGGFAVEPQVEQNIESARGGGSPLASEVRGSMEGAFGADFSGVRVHTDGQSDQLNRSVSARAFTTGSDIFFRSGEYSPGSQSGQELLAHELTHVVQQGGGVSRQTAFGQRLLQRAVATMGGSWDTDKYDPINDGTQDIGLTIDLKFTPNNTVDASKIGLTQTANTINNGTPTAISNANTADTTVRDRSVPAGEPGHTAGAHIDHYTANTNPLYAVDQTTAGGSMGAVAPTASFGQHGWHYTDASGTLQTQDAHLKDGPQLPSRGANASQIFETTALAAEGIQNGTYYGSVRWGWQTDADGKFTKLPLSLVSQGVPSPTFMRAAELWNATPTSGGLATIPLPTATINAAAMSSVDIITNIQRLATEITALAAGPGVDRTNKELDKQRLEDELRKRNAKVDIKVNKTEGWIFDDKVYIKMTGAGGAVVQTAPVKMGNGASNSFLVPLADLIPMTGTIKVQAWDHDMLDPDDLILTKDWGAPYGPASISGGVGSANYDMTIQFEK